MCHATDKVRQLPDQRLHHLPKAQTSCAGTLVLLMLQAFAQAPSIHPFKARPDLPARYH
jgi:hypothetical protein